jgi:hypothetical protein
MPLATASTSAAVSEEMGCFYRANSWAFLLTVCQTLFDVGQATLLQEHTQALSVRQAVAQSRNSRGLLDTVLRRDPPPFKPTYNHRPDGSACRIFGTVGVKKVTGGGFHSVETIGMLTPPLISKPARHNSWAWLYQPSAC